MSVRLQCRCGTSFTSSPEHAGEQVRCPGCGTVRRLPARRAKKTATVPPDPLADWKSKRGSKSHSKTLWIATACGVGVVAVILGILSLRGGSEEAATASNPAAPANDQAAAVANPTPAVLQTQLTPNPSMPDEDEDPLSQDSVAIREDLSAPKKAEPQIAKPEPPVQTPKVSPSEDSKPIHPEPPQETVAAVSNKPVAPPSVPAARPVANVNRSRDAVLALIAKVGRTPPDWYDATPLNYPKTLDLSFPQPPPDKGWNNQKNVGQFVWDVINPNPGRWREGVRLMHHLLLVNKDNRTTLGRIMAELGRMYHELLQDYPRAAFWYQQAGIGQGSQFERSKNGAHLAECYWRLGNRQMAIELLNKLPVTFESIKLWGDLGETKTCVDLANRALPNARFPAQLHLMIGDAHRMQGDFDDALSAYQEALDEAKKGGHARQNAFRLRAAANIAAIQAVELLDLSRVPDGAYQSSSIGYEGPVEIEVRIRSGGIESVRVTKHKEKQFYSSIEDTPRKIVEQQGIKNVDATSGATITSEAIINATAKALAAAMKK